MAKQGQHKHDSNDPRISKGSTTPSQSQTITTGTPKEVLAHPEVIESYLGTTDTDLSHLAAANGNSKSKSKAKAKNGRNGKGNVSRTRPLVASSRRPSKS